MDRQGKEQLKAEFHKNFELSNGAILAEFRGMTVAQLTMLRRALRTAKCEFKVLKNRIAKRAVQDGLEQFKVLVPQMKGPLGVVYLKGDAAQGVKQTLEFQKTNPLFVITSAVIDRQPLSKDQLKAVADLPSKDVLLAQIVGSMVAPHRGLLGCINGVSRNLVQVLAAIRDKKEKAE
jgi:large subunit ribosomal protein L10